MTRILALVLALAGVLLAALWINNNHLRTRVSELETRVRTESADAAGEETRAEVRERVINNYIPVYRDIEAHAPTPESCLLDPRLAAAYDGVERLHPDAVRPSRR